MQPLNSTRLRAARGWLELGNHQAALEELEEIEPEWRTHPDVLEVRWLVCEMAEKWKVCIDISNTLIEMKPDDLSCWIRRSYVLHKLERTQEAYDELKPALEKFNGKWLLQYNLACYTCLLGNVEEARELIEEAIELGGAAVKLRALDDKHLIRVWAGP